MVLAQTKKSWHALLNGRYYQILTVVFRIILGASFLVSGISKMQEGVRYSQDVSNYTLLPQSLTTIATAVPFIEIIIGTLLIVGLGTKVAALAASLFLIIFFVLAASHIFWAELPSCDCSVFEQESAAWNLVAWHDLLQTLIFIIFGFHIALEKHNKYSIDYLIKKRRAGVAQG